MMRTAGKAASTLAGVFLVASGCGHRDEPTGGLSGIDESFLDRSTSACVDFYQFACGTWIKEHPPGNHLSTERFLEGDTRNAWLINTILEGDRKGVPPIPHPDSGAIGTFYGACMESRSSTLASHTPLDRLLEGVNAVASLEDLAPVLANLHSNGVGAWFWLGAQIDPGNPARSIPTLTPNGLSLPDRSYYLDPSSAVLASYRQHIQKMATLYGASVDPEAVVVIETAMAEAMISDADLRDPVATYNLLAFDALASVTKNVPWPRYFEVERLAPGDVNVTEPVYVMKLDALLAATPVENLKSYLRWRVLEAYAHALDKRFIEEEAVFHGGTFGGDPTPASDWWACLQSTESVLGFALSRPFVAARFDDARRDAATRLLGSMTSALGDELAARPWLDDATRSEAQAKLSQIVGKVGYPDAWPQSPTIDSFGSFLEQELSASRWLKASNLQQVSRAVDRSAWRFAPTVTNAFYSNLVNDVTFPAAILQTPVFDPTKPAAINYGTMGAIMGHELTHGFDDVGRHFDGSGKLRDWWSPDVAAEFTRRAACVVDQYAGYEVLPGVSIDGRVTLGENVADLGGLRLAYQAYRASPGASETFNGSFDGDQQFFLAYAQLRCASLRDEVQETRVRGDSHAPPKFRVNGAVRNLPEFAAAFQCSEGDAMAPHERCDVW